MLVGAALAPQSMHRLPSPAGKEPKGETDKDPNLLVRIRRHGERPPGRASLGSLGLAKPSQFDLARGTCRTFQTSRTTRGIQPLTIFGGPNHEGNQPEQEPERRRLVMPPLPPGCAAAARRNSTTNTALTLAAPSAFFSAFGCGWPPELKTPTPCAARQESRLSPSSCGNLMRASDQHAV